MTSMTDYTGKCFILFIFVKVYAVYPWLRIFYIAFRAIIDYSVFFLNVWIRAQHDILSMQRNLPLWWDIIVKT